jgi:5-methylcytosine-specific restriction protein A
MLVGTHLFAWNPALWSWPELASDTRRLARRGHLDTEWSAGRTRNLEPGSRAYLVRLGVPPKGLFGAGTVMTAPVRRAHWRDDKAAEGATTGYVMLRLDALFEMPVVTFDDLAREPFAGFRWGIRQSGVRVPGPLAEALEALWTERCAEAGAAGTTSAPARSATKRPRRR